MTDNKCEIDESVFKACDIRGEWGVNITPELFRLLGRAIGTELGGESAVVGGDVRPGTRQLKSALIDGLASTGCRVTDIGIVPTPMLYFAKRRRRYAGALMVTASHNPARYNGLKFMLGNEPALPAIMAGIRRRVVERDFTVSTGSVHEMDVMDDYREWLKTTFTDVTFRPLRILVDAGTGCWSEFAPQILRELGFDVVELNCTPDGTFPARSPNPSLFENLAGTAKAVNQSDVDFAVAYDGDGDRVVFLDGTGRPIETDRIAVLFIRRLLKDRPGSIVVYDIKCSDLVRREIAALRCKPVIERSGHSFIRKRMMEDDAVFGAEVSGHYFFRELQYGDDALYATLKMAAILSATGRSLRESMESIPVPVITKDLRINLPEQARGGVIERLKNAFADHPQLDVDGIRIEWPYGWALCRISVTEPVITLRFEADTSEALSGIVEEVARAVPDLMEPLRRTIEESKRG